MHGSIIYCMLFIFNIILLKINISHQENQFYIQCKLYSISLQNAIKWSKFTETTKSQGGPLDFTSIFQNGRFGALFFEKFFKKVVKIGILGQKWPKNSKIVGWTLGFFTFFKNGPF